MVVAPSEVLLRHSSERGRAWRWMIEWGFVSGVAWEGAAKVVVVYLGLPDAFRAGHQSKG